MDCNGNLANELPDLIRCSVVGLPWLVLIFGDFRVKKTLNQQLSVSISTILAALSRLMGQVTRSPALIPNFSNPLGRCMSEENKSAIAKMMAGNYRNCLRLSCGLPWSPQIDSAKPTRCERAMQTLGVLCQGQLTRWQSLSE